MGVDDFFSPHRGSTANSFSPSILFSFSTNHSLVECPCGSIPTNADFNHEPDYESGSYFDDHEPNPKSGSYFDDPDLDYDDDDPDSDDNPDPESISNSDPNPDFDPDSNFDPHLGSYPDPNSY
ncbi:unnamed protein product [Prunus armeniaca]